MKVLIIGQVDGYALGEECGLDGGGRKNGEGGRVGLAAGDVQGEALEPDHRKEQQQERPHLIINGSVCGEEEGGVLI